MPKRAGEAPGLEAIDHLDRVIHEPGRLKIMSQLHIVESGDFVYLLHSTGLTRGNLSSHIARLERAGYVKVAKEFVNRKPVTSISLTQQGRKAFQQYRKNIASAIGAAGS
jgi:DNA-binding MarR family transcriptional regulator